MKKFRNNVGEGDESLPSDGVQCISEIDTYSAASISVPMKKGIFSSQSMSR